MAMGGRNSLIVEKQSSHVGEKRATWHASHSDFLLSQNKHFKDPITRYLSPSPFSVVNYRKWRFYFPGAIELLLSEKVFPTPSDLCYFFLVCLIEK